MKEMGIRPIFPLLLSMALPPMISMFLQYTYNVVDSMFVSWLSEDALTAISLAFPIQSLIVSVGVGAGVGANVLIARKLGADDPEGANNIVSHSLIFAGAISILFVIFGILLIPLFFKFFATSEQIYKLGCSYTYIITLISFGSVIHINIQKIIQATGNTIAPMLFQIAGVMINLILNPILIFGLYDFPMMGVEGSAIATIIGQIISMVLAFITLSYFENTIKIKTKGFIFDLSVIKEIFLTGFPSLMMNVLSSLLVLFVNFTLITYSYLAVAVFGIYYKIQTLAYMTVNGVIQGALPIMGYSYGAKNNRRLFETWRAALVLSIGMLMAASILIESFPVQILKIFAASPEMIGIGVECLRIIGLSYIFAAFGFMCASYFQSVKKIGYSLLINLLRQIILLWPLTYLLLRKFDLIGVWWAFTIAEFITSIIAMFIFLKTEKNIMEEISKT